jgi:hypothetical protein
MRNGCLAVQQSDRESDRAKVAAGVTRRCRTWRPSTGGDAARGRDVAHALPRNAPMDWAGDAVLSIFSAAHGHHAYNSVRGPLRVRTRRRSNLGHPWRQQHRRPSGSVRQYLDRRGGLGSGIVGSATNGWIRGIGEGSSGFSKTTFRT